jgi:hypothetical protein
MVRQAESGANAIRQTPRTAARRSCWVGAKIGHRGLGSIVSFGDKLDEFLITPMAAIVTSPDLTIDEAPCDRSTRDEDRP